MADEEKAVTAAEPAVQEPGTAAAAHEPSYTKAQILTFVRYAHRRDLLSALLKEEEKYTHADIESAIRNFMEGGKG